MPKRPLIYEDYSDYIKKRSNKIFSKNNVTVTSDVSGKSIEGARSTVSIITIFSSVITVCTYYLL